MALYKHKVNTHLRHRRASKFKRFSILFACLILLGAIGVGVDWLITNISATNTVISTESSATVQSARINIFQTPYYRFQADSTWREVTDELNLKDSEDGSEQYLYRSFDKNFIEHEILVTVNMPANYQIATNYIPTRVVPVRIESDGGLTQIGSVSKPCVDVLPTDNPNLEPHIVVQNEVEYFCNPNEVNDFHVAVGIPGGTTRLSNMPGNPQKAVISITYRNITAIPTSSMFENILTTFKLL
jgi:hypothetical protein